MPMPPAIRTPRQKIMVQMSVSTIRTRRLSGVITNTPVVVIKRPLA